MPPHETRDRWLRSLRSPGNRPLAGQARLVCCPHAGGSASYYSGLALAIGPSFDVVAVQYPGHADRFAEPFAPSLHAVAAASARALVSDEWAAPAVLFGHSMGAIVAYEIARELADLGAPPLGLVVSGQVAPWWPRDVDPRTMDDEALVRRLTSLGGTDQRLVSMPDFMDIMLPILRADYSLLAAYRHRPGPVLDCPVIVLYGREDPEVGPGGLAEWARCTTGPHRQVGFDGGHFYVGDHWGIVAAWVEAASVWPGKG